MLRWRRASHRKASSQAVTGALAELPAERERAAELGARTPDRRALWRLLARRGFAPETIEDVVGPLDEPADSGYHTDTFTQNCLHTERLFGRIGRR